MSIKRISQLDKIEKTSDLTNKAYFVASVVDGNIWNTKNIKYDVLSNAVATHVGQLIPLSDFAKIKLATESYIATSSDTSAAVYFSKKWDGTSLENVSLDDALDGIEINNSVTSYVTSYVDTKVITEIDPLSTNLNVLETSCTTLKTSYDTLRADYQETKAKVAKINLDDLSDLQDLVENIKYDIYSSKYTPGSSYNIIDNIIDLSDEQKNILTFIDPDNIPPDISSIHLLIKYYIQHPDNN